MTGLERIGLGLLLFGVGHLALKEGGVFPTYLGLCCDLAGFALMLTVGGRRRP